MRHSLMILSLLTLACSSTPADPNQKILSDLASKDDKVRSSAAESLRKISLQLPKIEGAKDKILAAFAVDGSHRGTLAMVMGKAWGEPIIPELLKGLRKEGLVPVTTGEKQSNSANRSIPCFTMSLRRTAVTKSRWKNSFSKRPPTISIESPSNAPQS